MGIGYINGSLLYRERTARPFCGSVLQLGRQHIAWTPPGYTGELTDLDFFRRLGFTRVRSCDVSDYEQPTFTIDLNLPYDRPSRFHGQFDCLYDGGTLEHVFHLPNALATLHDLLQVGGRVIHANPVSNYVDHGFYSFSPTFWWDWHEANKYRIEACYLIAARENELEQPRLYQYTPGCLDNAGRGACSRLPTLCGNDIWDCFFVATKLPESTCNVVPQQRSCRKMWSGEQVAADDLKYLGVI